MSISDNRIQRLIFELACQRHIGHRCFSLFLVVAAEIFERTLLDRDQGDRIAAISGFAPMMFMTRLRL